MIRKAGMKQVKRCGIVFVRWLGRQVCRVRGHHYFYPGGEVRSWVAYSCVRCGALDRAIESLPYSPDDECFDPTDTPEYQEYVEQQYEQERRWISWLPYLRWL